MNVNRLNFPGHRIRKSYRGFVRRASAPIEPDCSERYVDCDSAFRRKVLRRHRPGATEVHCDGIGGAVHLLNAGLTVAPHGVGPSPFDIGRE